MRNEYIKPSEFDKRGKRMKYPGQMDKAWRDVGSRTKIRPETVVLKDSKTGKVFGRRTIMTKSTSEGITKMTFMKDLLPLIEAENVPFPDLVVKEIQSNIRKGAKDLNQKWENALELVDKAFEVTMIKKPLPDQASRWKQYETLISYAVQQLTATRGLDGDWRISSFVPVDENETQYQVGEKVLTYVGGYWIPAIITKLQNSQDKYGIKFQVYNKTVNSLSNPNQLKKSNITESINSKRFFVRIPGAGQVEVDVKSIDDFIDKMINVHRRGGAKVRVIERDKKRAVLGVFIKNQDEKETEEERITVVQES